MIAPLRARHRLAAQALAFVVPAVLVAAIAVRQKPVTMSELPPALARDVATPTTSAVLVPAHGVAIDLALDADTSHGTSLTLVPRDALLLPTLLVYRTSTHVDDRLPDSAEFLGTMAGRRPRRFVTSTPGEHDELVFYSLGQARVVGHLAIPSPGGST